MGIKSKKEDRVRKMNGFNRLLLNLSESFFGLTDLSAWLPDVSVI